MKEKDRALEFLRVISCILVIVIHIANYYCRNLTDYSSTTYFFAVFFNAIARISVPIFFMISGALMIGKEFNKDKYISKLKKFFIVIIAWNFIYYVWNYFFLGEKINIVSTIFEPTKRHLWFMYAYIGFYIVSPFIQNMFKNLSKSLEKYFIILWILFNGLLYVITPLIGIAKVNTTINYPIPIIHGAYYLGYFVAGYVLHKNYLNAGYNKYKVPVWITFIASNIITIVVTYIGSIMNNSYFTMYFAYRSLFIMLSSLCFFYIVISNAKKFNKNIIIDFSGPYTFGIYLCHGIYLNILTRYVNLTDINSFVGIITFSLILFIISLFTCYIIKKIPILKQII